MSVHIIKFFHEVLKFQRKYIAASELWWHLTKILNSWNCHTKGSECQSPCCWHILPKRTEERDKNPSQDDLHNSRISNWVYFPNIIQVGLNWTKTPFWLIREKVKHSGWYNHVCIRKAINEICTSFIKDYFQHSSCLHFPIGHWFRYWINLLVLVLEQKLNVKLWLKFYYYVKIQIMMYISLIVMHWSLQKMCSQWEESLKHSLDRKISKCEIHAHL
jgi:hypothetical protein